MFHQSCKRPETYFAGMCSCWCCIHHRESHGDVIKWKHFARYWPVLRGIRRSPVNSPHKGQWRGALMFSLICVWINSCVNNCEAGDLRRHRARYDVSVMIEAYSQRHGQKLTFSGVCSYWWKWTDSKHHRCACSYCRCCVAKFVLIKQTTLTS